MYDFNSICIAILINDWSIILWIFLQEFQCLLYRNIQNVTVPVYQSSLCRWSKRKKIPRQLLFNEVGTVTKWWNPILSEGVSICPVHCPIYYCRQKIGSENPIVCANLWSDKKSDLLSNFLSLRKKKRDRMRQLQSDYKLSDVIQQYDLACFDKIDHSTITVINNRAVCAKWYSHKKSWGWSDFLSAIKNQSVCAETVQ